MIFHTVWIKTIGEHNFLNEPLFTNTKQNVLLTFAGGGGAGIDINFALVPSLLYHQSKNWVKKAPTDIVNVTPPTKPLIQFHMIVEILLT